MSMEAPDNIQAQDPLSDYPSSLQYRLANGPVQARQGVADLDDTTHWQAATHYFYPDRRGHWAAQGVEGQALRGVHYPNATTGHRFADPAPLGLGAFALATFILSLINMNTRNLAGVMNIVVAPAWAYAGFVQILAGMWSIAEGNTFAGTTFSSYGGFWISIAIIFTPGGFGIVDGLKATSQDALPDSFGLYLMGWFIFTTLLLFATIRTNLAFFLLFFFLDITFLLLAIASLHRDASGQTNVPVNTAGGFFGLLTAFLAWYNAMTGIYSTSTSFFELPVGHFPWSADGRAKRGRPKIKV